MYPEKSDIKYKHYKFPDGQQNLIIVSKMSDYQLLDSRLGAGNLKILKSVQIKSRLNNWLDLELIICAVASLRELDVKEIHLYVPYIVGARSDWTINNSI